MTADVPLPPGGNGQPGLQSQPTLPAWASHAAEETVLAEFVVADDRKQPLTIGSPQRVQAPLGTVAGSIIGDAHEG